MIGSIALLKINIILNTSSVLYPKDVLCPHFMPYIWTFYHQYFSELISQTCLSKIGANITFVPKQNFRPCNRYLFRGGRPLHWRMWTWWSLIIACSLECHKNWWPDPHTNQGMVSDGYTMIKYFLYRLLPLCDFFDFSHQMCHCGVNGQSNVLLFHWMIMSYEQMALYLTPRVFQCPEIKKKNLLKNKQFVKLSQKAS